MLLDALLAMYHLRRKEAEDAHRFHLLLYKLGHKKGATSPRLPKILKEPAPHGYS